MPIGDIALKNTLTYHNSVTADFDTIFLRKNVDLLINTLRQKTHHLTLHNVGVDLSIPLHAWRRNNAVHSEFIQEQFDSFIKHRLNEIFGDVPINIAPSIHLKGDDISLSWGRSFTRSGEYNIYLENQKLLCYADETLLDDGILTHLGFDKFSPFSLIIKENHMKIYRHQGDYEIKGSTLINTITGQEIYFDIIKEQ